MRPASTTASTLLALAALAAPVAGRAAMPVSDRKLEVQYLYSLASTAGVIPFSDVKLAYDETHRELWVTTSGRARVFNAAGMELYSFGGDPELGSAADVAALPGGDLVVLSYVENGWRLVRCNFRGEPQGAFELSGVPAGFFDDAIPTTLVVRGGKLYVASKIGMKALVADLEGRTLAARDFAVETDSAASRADLALGGFGVDRDGNMLFTVRSTFTAYVAPPEGKLVAFGQKGSAPGKFQVLGDIARDDDGFTYVVDVLKCAVIVFDAELRFVKEFGYRGLRPHNLVAPEELVVSGGRVFVSQRAKRGVSVFKVSVADRLSAGESPAGDPQM
jgi:hypothetical protein